MPWVMVKSLESKNTVGAERVDLSPEATKYVQCGHSVNFALAFLLIFFLHLFV